MTEAKKYRAFDSTKFEKESDCFMYETMHKYDGIKMWDMNGNKKFKCMEGVRVNERSHQICSV